MEQSICRNFARSDHEVDEAPVQQENSRYDIFVWSSWQETPIPWIEAKDGIACRTIKIVSKSFWAAYPDNRQEDTPALEEAIFSIQQCSVLIDENTNDISTLLHAMTIPCLLLRRYSI